MPPGGLDAHESGPNHAALVVADMCYQGSHDRIPCRAVHLQEVVSRLRMICDYHLVGTCRVHCCKVTFTGLNVSYQLRVATVKIHH